MSMMSGGGVGFLKSFYRDITKRNASKIWNPLAQQTTFQASSL
jgi:hypothetical protein